jgi:hypothetical protein
MAEHERAARNRSFRMMIVTGTSNTAQPAVAPTAKKYPRGLSIGDKNSARVGEHTGHKESIKCGASARERIDVRRAGIGVAVDAQVAPALLVGEDNNDVGLTSGRRGAGRKREQ